MPRRQPTAWGGASHGSASSIHNSVQVTTDCAAAQAAVEQAVSSSHGVRDNSVLGHSLEGGSAGHYSVGSEQAARIGLSLNDAIGVLDRGGRADHPGLRLIEVRLHHAQQLSVEGTPVDQERGHVQMHSATGQVRTAMTHVAKLQTDRGRT